MLVRTFIDSLDEPAIDIANNIFQKIYRVDTNGEISQLSTIFFKGLRLSSTSIPNSLLDTFGIANFFIWMAYSLYDRVIDNDLSTDHVMVANIFERKAVELYQANDISCVTILTLLNRTDQANAWEVKHCRFVPNRSTTTIPIIPSKQKLITMLASRSIAHISGPVSIFNILVSNTKKQQVLLEALTHYCIARQLNDDLHDWVDDFNNGRVTYVISHLLTKSEYVVGSSINTLELLEKLKLLFYESELEMLCDEIAAFSTSAIKGLIECGSQDNSLFIHHFLYPILLSAQKAKVLHAKRKTYVHNHRPAKASNLNELVL